MFSILQTGYYFNFHTDGCESPENTQCTNGPECMCCDLDTEASRHTIDAVPIIITVAVSIFLIAVIIGYIRRSIKQRNTSQQQQSPARQQHMTGAYPQGSVLTPQQYEEQQMQIQQMQQQQCVRLQPMQPPMQPIQPMQGQGGVVARPTMQVAMAVPVPVMTVPVVKVSQQPVMQYS